jgi:hypothetical protein
MAKVTTFRTKVNNGAKTVARVVFETPGCDLLTKKILIDRLHAVARGAVHTSDIEYDRMMTQRLEFRFYRSADAMIMELLNKIKSFNRDAGRVLELALDYWYSAEYQRSAA